MLRLIFSSVSLVLLISGCASNVTYTYRQSFNAGVSYEQAISQCNYENHLQNRADARADSNSGPGLLTILSGRPNNTQILCMNRFGFVLEEHAVSASSNSAKQVNSSQQFASQQQSQRRDASESFFKICTVKNVIGPSQTASKEAMDSGISFTFSKSDSSNTFSLSGFARGEKKYTVDMQSRGMGMYNDNEPYRGYSYNGKNILVQEFVRSNDLWVTLNESNGNSFLFVTECK